MSDSEKYDRVIRLNGYVNRLEDLLDATCELDFTQFETAGTTNWSGKVKKSNFDNEYKNASDQLAKAAPEIEEAISTCKSKMYSLAWSINDKWMKTKALAITTF
ncbi:hypothetical protein KYB31_19460 [Clostridium felsineum]|nr:hypothetical protein [Clostridium felsineum]MCR3761156.1 hypothetical protein [Clostridium felsineum]URZ02822.1 hypothetical protein CLAUR_028560 [Clostridium felsineum]URZ14168.1 hypothetical protein CLFE_001530 [Clostridium felsineum DSM 794]